MKRAGATLDGDCLASSMRGVDFLVAVEEDVAPRRDESGED
jgi:hypothetical protein